MSFDLLFQASFSDMIFFLWRPKTRITTILLNKKVVCSLTHLINVFQSEYHLYYAFDIYRGFAATSELLRSG